MDDRLERIDQNVAGANELIDATLAVQKEMLAVLRDIRDDLRDLRQLAEAHAEGLLRIFDRLDRLNPGGSSSTA